MCNQCEQTQGGRGCTEIGVCGKDPDMQSPQDIFEKVDGGKQRLAEQLA